MNLYNRIGMYLFIIGAVLSVLDGAFLVSESVRGLVYIVLIFTGIFAGLLNISEDEEHHFLVSAGAFLVVIIAFNMLFVGDRLLVSIGHFLQNAAAFIGSMAFVVALKAILEYASENSLVSPREDLEARSAAIDDWQLSTGKKVWHFLVFLAVAGTFLILLMGLPFYKFPDAVNGVISVVEWVIIAVFIADLFVLYREERNFHDFVHHCWVDIVAAVPVPGLFGALKIVRLARIARLTRGTQSLKFFSERSGMNTYLHDGNRRTEPRKVVEHPTAKPKKSAKG